ncbi:MAG: hypothetical protein OXH06_08270 [Gemmatimonadetes bacterium]|nr:hypothetical protein [Gemmatimonadota bacterium]
MKTFPLEYTAAGAAGQMSFHLPKAVQYEGNPVLAATEDQEFAGQDATYISVLPTAGVLSDPIDAYYAYVATHDGSEIWLATAPHPLGPWTWRRAVLELSATSFTKHISSPSAVMHNGEVYMYFHGVHTSGRQPTALATSRDGVHFEQKIFPIMTTHPNRKNHWYGQSVSYVRVVKDGPMFIGTFQGNGLGWNAQANGVTTVAGLAMSVDGIHWRLSKKPLLGNMPGSRGPFASILVRLWDRWLMLFNDDRGLSGALSEGSDVTGPYEDMGCVLESGHWPFPVFHKDKLYLLCGGINAAVIEWK